MEGAVEGGIGDWDEVVTRQPYRKVRLDHLLSKEHFTALLVGVVQSRAQASTVIQSRMVALCLGWCSRVEH